MVEIKLGSNCKPCTKIIGKCKSNCRPCKKLLVNVDLIVGLATSKIIIVKKDHVFLTMCCEWPYLPTLMNRPFSSTNLPLLLIPIFSCSFWRALKMQLEGQFLDKFCIQKTNSHFHNFNNFLFLCLSQVPI